MVKPSHFFGRCALSAILAVSMVPSAAFAQGETHGEDGLAALADTSGYPNSKDTDYSNVDMPVVAYWDNVTPGVSARFLIQFNDAIGDASRYESFQYRLDSVTRFTNGSWENIDYSYTNKYQDNPEFSITFQTSGKYRVRLSCFGRFAPGVSGYVAESSHIDIPVKIDHPRFLRWNSASSRSWPTARARAFLLSMKKPFGCMTGLWTTANTIRLWLEPVRTRCLRWEREPVQPIGQCMSCCCAKLGIQSQRMTGNGHEWNAVKLDGTWYQVDVTWDDDTGVEMSKLLSDEEKHAEHPAAPVLRHE